MVTSHRSQQVPLLWLAYSFHFAVTRPLLCRVATDATEVADTGELTRAVMEKKSSRIEANRTLHRPCPAHKTSKDGG